MAKKGFLTRFTLAGEIVLALIMITAVFGYALPAYNRSKDTAKEGEAKQNLHSIQVAVERYGNDHKSKYAIYTSKYPEFLIGGEIPAATDSSKIVDKTQMISVSDPLLREGYLDSYPRNPFAGNRLAMQVKKLQSVVSDPLRVGNNGDNTGFRFGKDCDVMGNVSCDYRFPTFTVKVSETETMESKSYADFDGYRFFDIWEDDNANLFLPGEFFYKAHGPMIYVDRYSLNESLPIPPVQAEQYVLGVYGCQRNRGMDVLGSEPVYNPYSKMNSSDYNQEQSQNTLFIAGDYKTHITSTLCNFEIWDMPTWTRWYNVKDSNGGYPGSPYSISVNQKLDYFIAGNPNGIKDSIILVLNDDGDAVK